MEGLSVFDDLFAVRLLELARHLSPLGNRVKFVEACEGHGVRAFLEQFPEVWERITDNPPREGITPGQVYLKEKADYSLKVAALQEPLGTHFEDVGIPFLVLRGLSLSQILHGDMAKREFDELEFFIDPQDAPRALSLLEKIGLESVEGSSLGEGQRAALIRFGQGDVFQDKRGGLLLRLNWRAFNCWVGRDVLPFREAWSERKTLGHSWLTNWRTLGDADSVIFLSLRGFQEGWSRLGMLLELALALEVLEYSWEQVLKRAGTRAVLVERAVELVVRLLGVPHPGDMTFHFRDYERALESWTRMAVSLHKPTLQLVEPKLWSCRSDVALKKRIEAVLTPSYEDIRRVALPVSLCRLYPVVHVFRALRKWLLESRKE